MNLHRLRPPFLLLALVPLAASLAGCVGAAEPEVGQDEASLSRGENPRVADVRDAQRLREAERFERCTRDWDCRPGDFCIAPDGDDPNERPDIHFCGREPDFACETDRECGRGAVCGRDGNCRRLRHAPDGCDLAHFRRIAQRIRNAVANGTMRPAVARQLWRRLANAVAEQCGDEGGRDDEGRGDDFRG